VRWKFRGRKQRDADLDDEIAHDLALEAEEKVRSGMPRQEAEHASHRDFGNVLLLKEGLREMWGWTSLERLAQDLRYAWRTLLKNPLFAAMAVLSLALGIGANTAIYSFMDAILMRTLPVQHPRELIILNWRSKGFPEVAHGMSGSWFNDPGIGYTSRNQPFPAFELLRTNNTALASLFAFADAGRLNLIVQGQAELAEGQFVSGGFFSGLGVTSAAGRLINQDDDRVGATPVVVISYNYWRRRFAESRGAIGQSILIDNTPFTIAGVSAPGFFGVNPARAQDIFIPLHAFPLFATNQKVEAQRRFLDGNYYWAEIMGRLRPGIRLDQAQAAFAPQYHQFIAGTASTQKEKADLPALLVEEGGAGLDSLRRQYSKPLFILMTMVGLILAIACANVANLLLARATARRREIAVRLSLGAGRLRVIRQLLTESVLLASIGGLLGVGVAALGIRFITWLLANGRDNFTLHANLSWPVLGFTSALTLLTGIVFGLVPAVQATKVDLTPALKETRASARRGWMRRINLSQMLVVSQIGISLLLVVAAGLFVRTLSNLHAVDLGFNRENVLLFSLNARQAGYKDAAITQFYAGLWRRFREIPAVRDVSLSDFPLVSNSGSQIGVRIPGVPPPADREPGASSLKVGPSFFTAMQIPILLGREIGERDISGSARVAVINELFAKKYFGDTNPVGRRFGLGDDESTDIEIIGVAKTARYSSLKRDIPPLIYIPYSHDPRSVSRMSFEIRTVGDPLASVSAIRQIVHQADPRVPVLGVNTQSRQIDQTIGQERTFADLGAGFAALALLISCVGLYGTMAYTVARRTSEIGIRMALGAERRRIIWMVLREVLSLVAAGLGIGLAVTWGTTRYIESFLFGMKHHDPLAISLSAGVLVAASILAGYAPASRASRIDPITALRHE
jgi:macrolide transport system ATP-binding/permease protein